MKTGKPHILHIAAENDSLQGAKIGGVADVIRDIAPALAQVGCRVTTLVPSHGFLHQLPGARKIAGVPFSFRGDPHWAEIFQVPGRSPHRYVRHCVLHHPWLDAFDPVDNRHRIYVHDGDDQPFFNDANRFACFCAAAAAAAAQKLFGRVDVLHLHDWHAALVALLRRYEPACDRLKNIRTVYSVHNIGIQGIRPMSGSPSSLEAWFPTLDYAWIDVADPHNPACVNLMATGIRLADRVHTVSPSYAEEIVHPSRKPHFYGAEGLEAVIAYVRDGDRLSGILNGCDYAEADLPTQSDGAGSWGPVLQREILTWTGGREVLPAQHFVAYQRLETLQRQPHPPETILTTVGRAVDQKMLLLHASGTSGQTALEQILGSLGQRCVWLLLGKGHRHYESYLSQVSARWDNFIFLNGYSDICAELLYSIGDLFLMPSSYEPCGISQMLAMRRGCPCVVHRVGGLRDTVKDQVNGLVFQGWTVAEQVDAFARTVINAVSWRQRNPGKWRRLCEQAASARFLWTDTARHYCRQLYALDCK